MTRLTAMPAALLILAFSATMSLAGKEGPEFQVNTHTHSSQINSSVADLIDGGFVVTWASWSQDGDNTGIYGQRYDAAGSPVGGEFMVNTTTAAAQDYPDVAGLADGGFLVSWQSADQDGDGNGIYGQRFDAAGNPVGGEFMVNKTTTNNQEFPQVAGLAGGGFLIVWQSYFQDGSGWGVYGQRYDAAGKRVGTREFKVNKTTGSNQMAPAAAALEDGGYIVTWASWGQDGLDFNVYAQRYSAAGKRVGKREFKVNKTLENDQHNPAVAGLEDGGFAITWESESLLGDEFELRGQRYDAAGKRAGKREFMVNKSAIADNPDPGIAGLVDGGFVITWQTSGVDGDSLAIVGQRYNSAGKRVGNRQFRINTTTASVQYNSDVAGLNGLGGGGFVATWESFGNDGNAWGIFGQRYAP